jgi:hypothetical protein
LLSRTTLNPRPSPAHRYDGLFAHRIARPRPHSHVLERVQSGERLRNGSLWVWTLPSDELALSQLRGDLAGPPPKHGRSRIAHD